MYAAIMLAATCVTGAALAVEFAGVRGVVRSEIETTLSSDVVARIIKIPFAAGDRFKKGDVLIQFDCARLEADLEAAEAEVQARQVTLAQNNQLLRYRAGGANDVAIARAKFAQARAAAKALKVQLAACTIHAPFDGSVAEKLAEIYETPQAYKPLLKVVKDGQLRVELIVPSHWLMQLRRGQAFKFTVDETRTVHTATVLQLGAVVDPASRSVIVRALLPNDIENVRPGMSGSAQLNGAGAE